MAWWIKSTIPYRNSDFQDFVKAFVFECPVCTKKKLQLNPQLIKKRKKDRL